jgi:arylsulfatase
LETRRELFQSLAGNRRTFLKAAVTGAISAVAANADSRQPNVILICCDDLGYGDLSSFGGSIRTPNLDQFALEGIRCTQHTSAACVCSPARASILTGRYPNRYGIPRVLNPADNSGLPDSEVTIAKMLKASGYATTCIGKWHLGSMPQFMPTDRGFDDFYGIPYSADMSPLPLMQNLDTVEMPTDISLLQQKFTQRAVNYINNASTQSNTQNNTQPFFMYFAPAAPHLPLMPSAAFQGSSGQGLYGDVVTEIDSCIGLIMQTLKSTGLDSNTLVLFTSDHGPWYQGSTGGLRQRKGEIFEGGVRVPLLARYPGAIPPGQTGSTLTTSLDLLPTIAAFTGAVLPANPVDGIDISPLLRGWQYDLTRDAFLYFNDVELQAARLGQWKLHVTRFNTWAFSPEPASGRLNLPLPNPELYNVMQDADESHDRSLRNTGSVSSIRARMDALIQTFPSEIINAWNNTFTYKVQNTSVGALPVQITS